MEEEEKDCRIEETALSRRDFLLGAGASVVTIMLSSLPGMAYAKGTLQLLSSAYPKKKIGTISGLKIDEPVEFSYPYEHPNCRNLLIRMGTKAAGGIGEQKDIVAFNLLCTHMGGSLDGTYRPEHKAMGPCPMHLTTFDLRRHGMIVAGHATTTLPQIILTAEGDDIYATGVLGLIYGFHDNLSAP